MSALTVTLGADISSLTRAMAGATAVVSATAKRMAKITGSGMAGLGKGGAAALEKGFMLSGLALKAGIGAALAGGDYSGWGRRESRQPGRRFQANEGGFHHADRLRVKGGGGARSPPQVRGRDAL